MSTARSLSSTETSAAPVETIIKLNPLKLASLAEKAIFSELVRQHDLSVRHFEAGTHYPIDSDEPGKKLYVELTGDVFRAQKRNEFLVEKPHTPQLHHQQLAENGIHVAPISMHLTVEGADVKVSEYTDAAIIIGSVDVSAMTDDVAQFVGNLLHDAHEKLRKKDFSKVNRFTFQESGSDSICVVDLRLSNKLVRVESKSRPDHKYSYAVLGKELGEGSYGEVYEVIGTLKAVYGEHALSFHERNRIVKRQEHDENYLPKEVLREHEIALLTPHLRGKKPTIIDNSSPTTVRRSVSYRIEERMRGKDLCEILIGEEKALILFNDLVRDLNQVANELHYFGGTLSADKKAEIEKTTSSKIDAQKSYTAIQRSAGPESEEFAEKYYEFLIIHQREQRARLREVQKEILTVKNRLQLALTLLHALHNQIHERDIIHRDIKPDNIIVDLDHHRAFIVDIGLSKRSSSTHKDGHVLGTYGYMPLEILEGKKATVASDIHSMGVTIGVLFGQYVGDVIRENAVDKAKRVNRFPNLFHGISGLTDKEKTDIYALLQCMTDPDSESRYSIAKAMKAFEALLADRLEAEAANDDKADVRRGHNLGRVLRGKCDKMQEHHDGSITAESVTELLDLVWQTSQKVVDKPEAMHAFTDRLYMSDIDGITSKAAFQEKVADIKQSFTQQLATIDGFLRNLHQIEDAYDDAEDASEEQLLAEVREVIKLARKARHRCDDDHYQLNVSSIIKLNKKFAKDIARIEPMCAGVARRHLDRQALKGGTSVSVSQVSTTLYSRQKGASNGQAVAAAVVSESVVVVESHFERRRHRHRHRKGHK